MGNKAAGTGTRLLSADREDDRLGVIERSTSWRVNGRRRTRGERGASLVEFALVAPFLLALLLGIVDFGWLLAQQQDLRYGAREAARLATVNTDSAANMTLAVCDAMDITSGAAIVWSEGGGGTGDTGTVDVTINVGSLTGFSALPFVGVVYPSTLTSGVEFRLEQDATNWSTGTGTC